MPIEVRKPTPQDGPDETVPHLGKGPPLEFPYHYDEQETCLILTGEVTVQAAGQIVSFGTGDYVVFPQGLDCTWKVLHRFRKHYKFG